MKHVIWLIFVVPSVYASDFVKVDDGHYRNYKNGDYVQAVTPRTRKKTKKPTKQKIVVKHVSPRKKTKRIVRRTVTQRTFVRRRTYSKTTRKITTCGPSRRG